MRSRKKVSCRSILSTERLPVGFKVEASPTNFKAALHVLTMGPTHGGVIGNKKEVSDDQTLNCSFERFLENWEYLTA